MAIRAKTPTKRVSSRFPRAVNSSTAEVLAHVHSDFCSFSAFGTFGSVSGQPLRLRLRELLSVPFPHAPVKVSGDPYASAGHPALHGAALSPIHSSSRRGPRFYPAGFFRSPGQVPSLGPQPKPSPQETSWRLLLPGSCRAPAAASEREQSRLSFLPLGAHFLGKRLPDSHQLTLRPGKL